MGISVEIVFITGGSASNPRPREHFYVFASTSWSFCHYFFFSLHNVLRFFWFVRSIKSLFCTDLPLTDPYTANKKEKVSYNFILSGHFSHRQAKLEVAKIQNPDFFSTGLVVHLEKSATPISALDRKFDKKFFRLKTRCTSSPKEKKSGFWIFATSKFACLCAKWPLNCHTMGIYSFLFIS